MGVPERVKEIYTQGIGDTVVVLDLPWVQAQTSQPLVSSVLVHESGQSSSGHLGASHSASHSGLLRNLLEQEWARYLCRSVLRMVKCLVTHRNLNPRFRLCPKTGKGKKLASRYYVAGVLDMYTEQFRTL